MKNTNDIINTIKLRSKEFEQNLTVDFRKATGSYYTDFELTDYMIEELFNNMTSEYLKNLENKTFLEPCVGVGNFVFSYLNKISNLNFSKKQIYKIINNIYVCDSNENALNLYKELFKEFVNTTFKINLNDDYFKTHIGSSLLFDVTKENNKFITIDEIFPNINKFDIIITNPPYKNLRAEKKHFDDAMKFEKTQNIYSFISNFTKKHFNYANEGTLNLYKLFIEEIVENYSSNDALISLLIPSSLLSDKTCEKLRTRILTNNNVIAINIINESNKYIDAKQSLCTLLLQKNLITSKVKINPDFCKSKDTNIYLSIENILNKHTGNAIFAIGEQDYLILEQLKKFKTVKDLDFITNMRGELDLTLNKKSITSFPTKYKLLRGKNISKYFISDMDNFEYIQDDFVENSSKKSYIQNNRIICQQVANMQKEHRVTFALIDSNYVLGNSCNYVSISNNKYGIDLYYLLGLFNSSIINWFFKLTSTNNHVNNYEIDSFPITLEKKYITKISNLVKSYLTTKDSNILNEIDKYVKSAYGLSVPESSENLIYNELNNTSIKYYNDIKYLLPKITLDISEVILNENLSIDSYINSQKIELTKFNKNVCKFITEKYIKLSKNIILNHTTFTLSKLDMEMIENIPQGGNWKNIPQNVIQKSQRLTKISQTGGRTTLYGRIDYNKPSYTITTYFSRPGNGTYVHPIHNRVISVREAARFQSFKDDYYFVGNKTSLLKQVGNAVPPLLAFQVGRQIIKKTNCNKSIDLFCGAGGISVGFKEAGIKSFLGTDFDESACTTFAVNNPDIPVLCGDITDYTTKENIINIGIKNKVDIVCGGPPCQGFSLAGKRFIDDPRNQLFKHFVDVVEKVKPKIVVFENVEGLLTFDNGNVYRQILDLFNNLDYETCGKLLLAHEYGVPQKRKRVIIICVSKSLKINPEELFPQKITIDPSTQITARDVLSDLETIPCSDTSFYNENYQDNNFIETIRNLNPFSYYIEALSQSHIQTKDYSQLSLF